MQRKINELELRSYFQEVFRNIKSKLNFGNEPTPDFSSVPYVMFESKWSPPKGHHAVEVF